MATSQVANAQSNKKEIKLLNRATEKMQLWENPNKNWNHVGVVKIDSIALLTHTVEVYFNTPLSYWPIRETMIEATKRSLKEALGRKFQHYDIKISTGGQPIESLVPNYYRKTIPVDTARFGPGKDSRIPLVRRVRAGIPSNGLYNRNIALWHSHGWYYEAKLDRWEWQRARLFGTVEDIFPMTFVLPYLVPMLENAGANVFLPRERDVQNHEVIVDNDLSSEGSELTLGVSGYKTFSGIGFKKKDTLFIDENPFLLGSHFKFKASQEDEQYLEYIPNIPEDGAYAVYISYVQSDENITDATYIVSHTGGKTIFLVNQQMGGSTWVYLGTFQFQKGINKLKGSVRLSTTSKHEGWITADAIRFGGGMGNIARRPADELLPNQWSLKGGNKGSEDSQQKTNPDQLSWKTSNRPRYMEGARYYLQYSGVPESLVYSLNKRKNDYNDDYQSRGEWVNYLLGAPNGPNANRDAKGLNIPIDVSMAFHTDAGVTPKDSIIGTLGIYSSIRDDGKFPNGQSKLVNRDLMDIVQSEIVHDIQAQFEPDWTRRGLWNKQYSEAWRPNIPAMLLELQSHQNLTDMSYGLDPTFKFVASRAIYKGIAKFIAFQNNATLTIQPLPVDHFSMQKIGKKTIQLSWSPVLDTLEFTAAPFYYKVYKRIGNSGFDNGRVVSGTSFEIEIDAYDKIYSYKVTANNSGGESFPSEILSVGLSENSENPVLVVNGFDRISAPKIIDEGSFAGVAHWEDEGVPDKYNIGYTGQQYDFNRNSPWLDDDSPGWGASYGNMEGKLIPGNSFDNTIIHGQAILATGNSFISTSDEAFSDPDFDLKTFRMIDLILGEEKTTSGISSERFKVFDKDIQHKINEFTSNGGNVFASGAYIGSDHILTEDSIAQKFANEILHFKWRTNHAVRKGEVRSADYANNLFPGILNFNTGYHPKIYKVEAPDAIEPAGTGAISAFRYEENNTSAGTAYDGAYKTVILGFPFETILDELERNRLMKQIINYFNE